MRSAFIREVAKQAGHELDFSVVTRERMLQASIAGHEQAKRGMMHRMFIEISDKVRVAALDKAIDALNANGFPWNDAYIAATEPGHQVEVILAGIAGEQFMARTAAEILIGQTSDLPQPRPSRRGNLHVRTGCLEAKASAQARPIKRRRAIKKAGK